jgi:hypothetical protein
VVSDDLLEQLLVNVTPSLTVGVRQWSATTFSNSTW